MSAPVRLSCDRTAWLTPEPVLAAAQAYFGGSIPLDPATEPDNPTRALAFYAPPADGLTLPWDAPVWLNPPYGRDLARWVERAGREAAAGLEVVLLLPGNRWETSYLQRHVLTERLTAMCALRGRLAFRRPGEAKAARANPYGSVLYLLNGDAERFAAAFAPLGRVLRVRLACGGMSGFADLVRPSSSTHSTGSAASCAWRTRQATS